MTNLKLAITILILMFSLTACGSSPESDAPKMVEYAEVIADVASVAGDERGNTLITATDGHKYLVFYDPGYDILPSSGESMRVTKFVPSDFKLVTITGGVGYLYSGVIVP